jgi:magnesium transporter
MLTIYKHSETGLNILTEPVEGCWISLVDPNSEEVARVQAMGIPLDYLTYPLDFDERARTERENGDLLIIFRVPYYQGTASDVPYTSIPLGIIINDHYLVTVCRQDNDILQDFASGKMRGLSTGKRFRFILRLLLNTAQKYLFYLREINKRVDALEDQLQKSTRNREVLELLKYEKSLTYFTTALKGNELLLERLQRSGIFRSYPEDEDLLEDVLTENQQAIEMVNISNNILSSMMDAFASIISNNLNGVMKFLASVTIVLSIPTIIASFYGMNVRLPFEENPWAFLVVIGFILLFAIPVVIIFNRKDWF